MVRLSCSPCGVPACCCESATTDERTKDHNYKKKDFDDSLLQYQPWKCLLDLLRDVPQWLQVLITGSSVISIQSRFDTSRLDTKSFRDIIKVDSIHVESRFDSTEPLCSQLFIGPTGAKIADGDASKLPQL